MSSRVAAAPNAFGASNPVLASKMPAASTESQISEEGKHRPLKVAVISLGCAKNLVDAEIMLGSVLKCGMTVSSCAEEADVLVVNTCAFIDSAKEESIEAILEADQQRGLNGRSNQKLIVSGCMSQRFARELHNELPEIDAFIGLDQVKELGQIVESILGRRPTLNDVSDLTFTDT